MSTYNVAQQGNLWENNGALLQLDRLRTGAVVVRLVASNVLEGRDHFVLHVIVASAKKYNITAFHTLLQVPPFYKKNQTRIYLWKFYPMNAYLTFFGSFCNSILSSKRFEEKCCKSVLHSSDACGPKWITSATLSHVKKRIERFYLRSMWKKKEPLLPSLSRSFRLTAQ